MWSQSIFHTLVFNILYGHKYLSLVCTCIKYTGSTVLYVPGITMTTGCMYDVVYMLFQLYLQARCRRRNYANVS